MKQNEKPVDDQIHKWLNPKPPRGFEVNPFIRNTMKLKFKKSEPIARSLCGSTELYKDHRDKLQA